MMRGVVPALEKHHNVRILDEGLAAAVKLSHRYLPDRQLPDKAVSVLDTACARLALGQNATPGPSKTPCARWTIWPCRRASWSGKPPWARITPSASPALRQQKAATEASLADLNARWEKERGLVTRIREIRAQLEDRQAMHSAAATAAAPRSGRIGCRRSAAPLR